MCYFADIFREIGKFSVFDFSILEALLVRVFC